MDNVRRLPGSLVTVDEVLDATKLQGFKEVIVIGISDEGRRIGWTATSLEIVTAIGVLEVVKSEMLDELEDGSR